MSSAKKTLKQELDEIEKQIEDLEKRKREIYKASLKAPEVEKICEDHIAKLYSYEGGLFSTIKYPVQIHGIDIHHQIWNKKDKNIGRLVKIRPCNEKYENKTFLGFYLGDLPQGLSVSLNKKTEILHVQTGYRNPAIWIPELQEIIWGCESFWGLIESKEQLKDITDETIDNLWYVRALKESLGSKNKKEKPDGEENNLESWTNK